MAWFRCKGIYDENPANDLNGIPFVGDLSKLISDARHGELDRIYIAMNMHDEAKIKKLLVNYPILHVLFY